MNKKNVGYWALTGILAFAMASGGLMQATGAEEMLQNLARLGYPAYFATILGLWKIAAAVAVLVPGFARIKEWAYAGIGFAMTGAFVSHLAAGDPAGQAIPPLFVLAIAIGSYVLRPASRRMTTPAAASNDRVPNAVPAQA